MWILIWVLLWISISVLDENTNEQWMMLKTGGILTKASMKVISVWCRAGSFTVALSSPFLGAPLPTAEAINSSCPRPRWPRRNRAFLNQNMFLRYPVMAHIWPHRWRWPNIGSILRRTEEQSILTFNAISSHPATYFSCVFCNYIQVPVFGRESKSWILLIPTRHE